MDSNRELWADAYRFYQDQAQRMEKSRDDLTTYFCNLAQEIGTRSPQASPEAKCLWKAIYEMLEVRSKC